MQPFRSDRVVRVLTAVVSLAYFVVWVGGMATLVTIPAAKNPVTTNASTWSTV